jgi:hypothetical protein
MADCDVSVERKQGGLTMSKSCHPQTQRKRNLHDRYLETPWRCEARNGQWEILAYAAVSDQWETIAVLPSGARTKSMANFIVTLINEAITNKDTLREASSALEAILTEGLNFSTEQDADRVVRRVKAQGI